MNKSINNSSPKKGFTLIEVILSMALLAIISTAFLTMFTSSIIDISNSGKKSASHYTAQSKIENNINDSGSLSGNVVTSTISITLTFPTSSYDINGRQINVPYNYGSITKTLTTFTTN